MAKKSNTKKHRTARKTSSTTSISRELDSKEASRHNNYSPLHYLWSLWDGRLIDFCLWDVCETFQAVMMMELKWNEILHRLNQRREQWAPNHINYAIEQRRCVLITTAFQRSKPSRERTSEESAFDANLKEFCERAFKVRIAHICSSNDFLR